MLEKPDISDDTIAACLHEAFALRIAQVTFLPIGWVHNAAYRITADTGAAYFLKLRRGSFDEISVAVPAFLHAHGIRQVMAPLATATHELWVHARGFDWILYPLFEGKTGFVDHLLRMRSGIADSQDSEYVVRYTKDPTMAITAAELIADAAGRADRFVPPDQKTVYTNVNYVMLEEIARMVTGKSMDVLVDEQIAQPLGLSATYYPTTNDLPGGLHGYSWNAESAAYEDKTMLNPAGSGGAGAMISTLADLRIYARALCTGALLKPGTQQARLAAAAIDGQPEWIRYGQGIETMAGFCGHNGTIVGFISEMYYLPEENAVIVIDVNRLDEDDRSHSSELFMTLAKVLFPENVAW